MNELRASLERDAVEALRAWLAHPGEEALHEAYALGREALERGLGLVAFVEILHRAARGSDAGRRSRDVFEDAESGADAFVLEALAPLDMALRGARESARTLRQLDEAREREVRQVAMRLHDAAAQLVATVGLDLDQLAAEMRPLAAARVARARGLLRDVEQQLRDLSRELHPPALAELGLAAALQQLCFDVTARSKRSVMFEGDLPQRLPAPAEITLYRIALEAVTNALRHAAARRIRVRLEREDHVVRLTVQDDGRGFDPVSLAPGSRGIGLAGMHERLSALGGRLRIDSRPGGGTTVVAPLPLEDAHVDPTLARR